MSDASNKTSPSPEHQMTSEIVVGTTVDPLVGREVGGYVIEKALGEGGMGLVYQARHPFLGRRFAVKVLRPELAADQQLSSNFVREAQTLSGLKHPHIIDIVGFGPLDGQRQYMIMEFLEGRTLEAELEEHGALPVHRVLSLAEEILDALEAAHSIDVIHRDLKPSNVFLAKVSGGNTMVKLLDFGLAKLQPQALAGDAGASVAKSTIAGTPDYIAPEQALGKGVSKLSDLYSFGVMLYEVLKGEKLFSARFMSLDPIHDLIDHHLHSSPPKLGEAFPEELERLVAELLEKDPTKRPQSVQLVRQRIRRITTHSAHHEGSPARADPAGPDADAAGAGRGPGARGARSRRAHVQALAENAGARGGRDLRGPRARVVVGDAAA
jgi:eukaryotic-like serine/threonine-protein kinase